MSSIARLETSATRHVAFVRLTTDAGEIGWGQCSTCDADITAAVFQRRGRSSRA